MINKLFLLVFISIGIVWTRTSYAKITQGNFIETLEDTLIKFGSNNPYGWYKNFLEEIAIPNTKIFGQMVLWGETIAAITLILGPLYLLWSKKRNIYAEFALLLGLAIGMSLNLNFWFASGWMSPSADNLNLLMFFLQFIGFVFLVHLIRQPSK